MITHEANLTQGFGAEIAAFVQVIKYYKVETISQKLLLLIINRENAF